MIVLVRVPVLMCAAVVAGCASTRGTASSQAAPSAAQSASGSFEKIGSLAPSRFDKLSLWLEEYAGAPLVLEVQPQGALVAEGDVIARIDLRPFQEALHGAELEAQSARVRHEGVVERNRIEDDEARAQLAQADAALARAQRALEGWKKYELAFHKREDEISKRQEQAYVDDQNDELDQLKKMYAADALVDATEDIVIKRSVRQLELTKTANQLSRERSQYTETLELALQTEQREESVQSQAEALGRLRRQQAVEARARQDAELRSADALREQTEKLARLRRDGEKLALRAPRAGMLLHGSSDDYRPGQKPPRVERGSTLGLRTDLFLIADPAPTTVAFELGDADRARLAKVGKLDVHAVGNEGVGGKGALSIEPHPHASSATEALYTATVTLDQPLEGAVYGACVKLTADAKQGALQ